MVAMERRKCRGLAADVFMPQRTLREVSFSDDAKPTRLLGRAPLRPRPLPEQVLMAHLGLLATAEVPGRESDQDFDSP
jgi:hypothetical protein